MKRIVSLLFIMVMFTSACASPAASTSAPVELVEVTSTSQSADVVPAENTAAPTLTPEPTITPTPEPPPARWYWALENETYKVLAVNQFGEQREIGSLPASEQLNSRAFPVDSERALLLTDDESQLHVYLLTLDGMQAIKLPSDLVYNSEISKYTLTVPAVYGDHAVFAYTSQQSSSSSMADYGPLVLVDLQSLKASVIDRQVNHNIFSAPYDTRLWAHASQDGRYLRYLDGDVENMNVRELDMSNGETRTIKSITGHATSKIAASFQGELWHFVRDGAVFDLSENQSTFKEDNLAFRPLDDERGMVLPIECDDNCEIKAVDPFNGGSDLAYNLPWATSYTFHNPLLYLLNPDQSLTFTGAATVWLSNAPALAVEYPAMLDDDRPVFRLTPEGGSHLLGFYSSVIGQDTTPTSTDGRYMLLGAVDHESFIIYDMFEDRPVAEMPTIPELDYFWGNAAFYDNGIVTHFLASTAENTYRDFFLVYSTLSAKPYTWENENSFLAGCIDILEDDTLICGTYTSDTGAQKLVRYDPITNSYTTLLENIFNLQFIW